VTPEVTHSVYLQVMATASTSGVYLAHCTSLVLTCCSIAVGKLSREEFRRQKDLDAARKAGTAPAALDEEGKAINPHIPQYISQAPWYLDTGLPSLAHQRRPDYDSGSNKLDDWYTRGQKAGPAATKYRKGACENCGAMTHKLKDCLERPRKKGAKFTGKDIQADEIIQDVQPGYAAKRDRWNGYDASEHKRIYDEYAAIEAARQKLREEEIDNQTTTDLAAVRKVAKAKTGGDDEFGSSDEEDADEDKYADAADAVGQKMDTKTRITVRNLRIREDTAKYLRNLDPDSAYYDPKTRSMREAPDRSIPPEEVSGFPFLSVYTNLADNSVRPCLLVTIFSDTRVRPSMLKSYSSLLGSLQHVAMMCIYMQTQQQARFCIKSTSKRRKNSRIRRKSAFWPSMEGKSICSVHPRSS
jgi:Pre-mRNA splicing Prp18-interacting factor